jgi:hypothetical protein
MRTRELIAEALTVAGVNNARSLTLKDVKAALRNSGYHATDLKSAKFVRRDGDTFVYLVTFPANEPVDVDMPKEKLMKEILRDVKIGSRVALKHAANMIELSREEGNDYPEFKAIEKSIGKADSYTPPHLDDGWVYIQYDNDGTLLGDF